MRQMISQETKLSFEQNVRKESGTDREMLPTLINAQIVVMSKSHSWYHIA